MKFFLLLLLSSPVYALDFTILETAAREEARVKLSTDVLYAAAIKYLAVHAAEPDNVIWFKKWSERVKQAALEDETEDKFTLRVTQTFIEDNHKLLEEPEKIDEKVLVQGCRLLCLCLEKKFSLPGRVREKLTPTIAQKVADFLKER
jgi:hypothetical protein